MDDEENRGTVTVGEDDPPGATPPPSRATRSSRWAAGLIGLSVPLMALAMALLAVAAAFGLVWVAAAALAAMLAIEVASVRTGSAALRLFDSAGLRAPIRALLGSLMTAVAIGVAADGEAAPLVLYGAAAVTAHGLGAACNTVIGWVLAQAPSFAARNMCEDLDLPQRFLRAKRHRRAGLLVPLMIEIVVVVGLAASLSSNRPTLVAALVTAAGLLAMVAWVLTVLRWGHRLAGGSAIRHYVDRLHDDLEAFEPEVLVYMSAAAGQAGYMLNQWLPALAAMRRRGVIVVREESNLDPIGPTSLPVVHAPATRDVERMVLPSVKLALYVANAGRNVQLLREPGIRHVFLNHGDSDKATSANPVSRVYDEVWVAGQAAVDRYDAAGVRIEPDRFAMIGRPQVDGLPVGPRKGAAAPRVLYAPTWEGIYEEVNYSSLEVAGPLIVETILRERPHVELIFKPHPASGAWRRGMVTARERVERLLSQSPHRDRHLIVDRHPGMTLNDCFEMADVLISDISSVVTDFLHTERPIVISNPIGLEPDTFRTMFPTQHGSYLLGPDFGRVVTVLDEALGSDPLATQRRRMKRHVLGDLPHGPIEAFSENVDRICEQAAGDAERVRNTFMFTSLEAAAGRDANGASLVDAIRRKVGLSLFAGER